MARGMAGFYAAQAIIEFAVAGMLLVFAWQAAVALPWYQPLSEWVALVMVAAGAISLAMAGRPRLQSEPLRVRFAVIQFVLSAYPGWIFVLTAGGIYMMPPPWWVLADPWVALLLPAGVLWTGGALGMMLTVPEAPAILPPEGTAAGHR